MEIIDTPEKMRQRARQLQAASWATPETTGTKKIGFVPTMGFLHEGHLSLVEQARNECETVIVSIFVNPIQFDNKDDLAKYPSNLERDQKLLKEAGVDLLFLPSKETVFPGGEPDIFIDYPALSKRLCGAYRESHFSGVLTIVHNLFMWTLPDVAFFGLKDYQQLLLIRKMTTDLSLDVEIRPGELVRAENGLALSSRNARLSEAGVKEALAISRSLFAVQTRFKEAPETPVMKLQEILNEGLGRLDVQYAGFYDPETLVELDLNQPAGKALVAVAAFVEGVRLIDNVLI